MITDQDLIAQFMSNTGETVEVLKIDPPEAEAAAYAETHCGVISGSTVAALCTYQPDIASIEQLENDIEELTHKIESSVSGKTKTATEARDSKQRQLDRMLSDELPGGANELCYVLAMKRFTGYSAELDAERTTKEMQYGKKYESMAVDALLSVYDNLDIRYTKENQKFVKLGDYEFVGCTPDGVIYVDDKPIQTLDIKCPFNRVIHARDNLLIKSFADFKTKYPVYYWQFTMQMICLDVTSHSFVSFNQFFPANLRLIKHDFVLVQQDADFMLERIAKAEKLIAVIIADLMEV